MHPPTFDLPTPGDRKGCIIFRFIYRMFYRLVIGCLSIVCWLLQVLFVFLQFCFNNIAGTSSEMTRRQSRRVISKEKTGGGHKSEGPAPEGPLVGYRALCSDNSYGKPYTPYSINRLFIGSCKWYFIVFNLFFLQVCYMLTGSSVLPLAPSKIILNHLRNTPRVWP